VGDFPGHAAGGELVAGFLRVVAGVEVDPDVIGQRAEVAELVQRGGQQRGVVAVRRVATPMITEPVPAPSRDTPNPRRSRLSARALSSLVVVDAFAGFSWVASLPREEGGLRAACLACLA
jgi:hypothetical protein